MTSTPDGSPTPRQPGAPGNPVAPARAKSAEYRRMDAGPESATATAMGRALAYVAARSGGDPVDPHLRVTLNFHPDRLTAGGIPVLLALSRDGAYRSQFETGTSNGGLTARPGGARWLWESRIFGAAYDEAAAAERPKYGSLNFRRRPVGGSPRFGSSHLRLRPETLARTTFCYPDSYLEPENFGVATAMSLISYAEADGADALDDYIEAQVHGPVRPGQDAEAVVLDPSFRGTEVDAAARLLGCPVEWHGGFRLSIETMRRYPEFRGPQFIRLGTELAVSGYLDPRIIGDASRTGRYDDQDLKRVWHYVARFGAPG
jgi:hypothetical protein